MALAALPIIAIGASVVGAGISAMGAIQSSNAQAAAAHYQSQVAANNAIVAQQNAQAAREAGAAKADQASLQTRAQEGSILAAQGASGVDVNTGSPVDVRTTQREVGGLAAQTDVYNANLQAYGYTTQGTNYQAQSQLDTMQAQSARAAGGISAAGSLIGGLGMAGSRFAWMSQNAGFGTGGSSDVGDFGA